MINAYGWHSALLVLAWVSLLIIPLAFMLPNDTAVKDEVETDQSIAEAVREAVRHRGYVLLMIGFFVCGFHVAFITVHFPTYVRDLGLAAEVGAYSLALVGLFNIGGAFMSGVFGQKYSKKGGLSVIYFARAVCITALLLAPKTEVTIYLFAASMGILWLSTVPLTTGIVAQVFGVRYMATLFGIVFFGHQLGSFSGIWLGGYLYDTIGSYDPVWWAGVILGVAAAAGASADQRKTAGAPGVRKPLTRTGQCAVLCLPASQRADHRLNVRHTDTAATAEYNRAVVTPLHALAGQVIA